MSHVMSDHMSCQVPGHTTWSHKWLWLFHAAVQGTTLVSSGCVGVRALVTGRRAPGRACFSISSVRPVQCCQLNKHTGLQMTNNIVMNGEFQFSDSDFVTGIISHQEYLIYIRPKTYTSRVYWRRRRRIRLKVLRMSYVVRILQYSSVVLRVSEHWQYSKCSYSSVQLQCI